MKADKPKIFKRFWDKVDIKSRDECWTWLAAKNQNGYGRFAYKGKARIATRVLWEIEHGVWPGHMCVLHHCDNPPCCNPRHLYLGTQKDNALDMYKRNRKVRKIGIEHPLSKLNDEKVIKILKDKNTCNYRLSLKYGVNSGTIYYIKMGWSWKHIDRSNL